jgi:hypothetical protein
VHHVPAPVPPCRNYRAYYLVADLRACAGQAAFAEATRSTRNLNSSIRWKTSGTMINPTAAHETIIIQGHLMPLTTESRTAAHAPAMPLWR